MKGIMFLKGVNFVINSKTGQEMNTRNGLSDRSRGTAKMAVGGEKRRKTPFVGIKQSHFDFLSCCATP